MMIYYCYAVFAWILFLTAIAAFHKGFKGNATTQLSAGLVFIPILIAMGWLIWGRS